MGKEIERKFLVNENKLPDNLENYPHKEIMQGYLSFEPEVRIRASKQDKKTKYYLTKKSDGAVVRDEEEKEISAEDFYDKLNRIGSDSLVRKTRYMIPLKDGLTAELDFYHNEELKTLKTVEIEFRDLNSAQEFQKPEWFGKDVTDDKSLKNKNLAKAIMAERGERK